MGFDKEIEIDIGRWMRAVLQKWWVIAITTLCGFGVVFAAALRVPAVYTAKATLYCEVNMNYKDAAQMLYYMKEYADVNGRGIAERAVLLLGNESVTAEEILDMVDFDYEDGTVVMYVEAVGDKEELAVDVANAVAESFVIEAQSLSGSNAVKIAERAVVKNTGISVTKLSIAGALFGFACPILLIVLKQMLSDKIYYVSDAELGGELEMIGIIPEQTKA